MYVMTELGIRYFAVIDNMKIPVLSIHTQLIESV